MNRMQDMADTIRRYQENRKALLNRARTAEDALRRANLEIEKLKKQGQSWAAFAHNHGEYS